MLLLWAVPLGIMAGYVRGGRLSQLAQLELRGTWLILIALAIQLLIFPLPGLSGPVVRLGTEYFHLGSYALLLGFVAMNRREWGIVTMGLGMSLNVIAIAANGGYMPTFLERLRTAGLDRAAAALERCAAQAGRCTHANNVLIREETPLWFLGDVYATPAWMPFANVFSVGDLLLALGLIAYLQAKMRG